MAVSLPYLGAVRRRTGPQRTVRVVQSVVTVLLGAIFVINLGAFIRAETLLARTHLTAALVALYLLVEARLYMRRSDAFGLLSPAVLALIFHFVFAYLLGITVSVFFPWVMERFGYWLPDLDGALSGALILAALAAFSMLRGYAIGQPLAWRLRRSLQASPLLRGDMRPVLSLAVAMQAVYIVLVAYAIQKGLYGLLGTAETRAQHFDVLQYLKLALAAGTLSYFLILVRHFERRKARQASSFEGLFVGLLIAVHVFAGALSGFKSQIVYPFVIAGFAHFLATRRVPLHFVASACVALVVAYAVIEPFRSYLGAQDSLPTSLAGAIESFNVAVEHREELAHESSISRTEAIASRFDIAGMTALATEYVDQGNLQVETRQKFQESILLAPILAYVPRALWSDKPIYSEGVWFNQSVRGMQNDENTSVGMGPIGFLYMAGGVAAVVVGFLSFGVLQALIFEGFARAGAGGLIVFLSVANSLVMIPSSFGLAVAGILQMLPVAFLAQLILLRRSRVRSRDLAWSPSRFQDAKESS